MKTPTRKLLYIVIILMAALALPPSAYADNCGSLSDCYGTIFAALLALLAIAAIIALIFALPEIAPFLFEAAEVGEAAELFPWLSEINAIGGATNCGACATAVDSSLAGEVISAFEIDGMPLEVLESEFGSFFSETGMADIESQLLGQGPGSRGIVYVVDEAADIAHVFNVANVDGTVWYIDGQIAFATTDGAEILSATGYTEGGMMFMPTW